MDTLHQHLFESVYLLLLSGDGDSKAVCDPSYYHFSIDGLCKENHFREYFGPSDLKTIYDFCQILDTQQQISKKPVALTVSAEDRIVTKALFLVGAYMILMLDMDEVNLADRFQGSIVPFGDVVHEDKGSEFGLDLQDCFAALSKAKDLRWVDFSPGGFDSHEYTHFDNPLNADMHEIVPGKLIAMRGPRDLPGDAEWLDVLREDGSFSHRDFSPQYYASLLHEFDVQVVVRCNTPQYDRRGLEDAGILVVDLVYEDGGCPPVDIMAKFMAVVEAVPGAVAVHGASGLGRSGTLIGLYMMKHHGFTAREAMGWMRIVRPGRYAHFLFPAQESIVPR